jgi:hypothetical protein
VIVDPWTAVAFFLVMLLSSNSTIVVGDNNLVMIHAGDEIENQIKTEP